jgi:hypothetical protein
MYDDSWEHNTVGKARAFGATRAMGFARAATAIAGAAIGAFASTRLGAGWYAATVTALLGLISGTSAGAGAAGIATFRRINRRETGYAAGALAFSLGSASGAALGAQIGHLIDKHQHLPHNSGAWFGLLVGYAIVGAAAGAIAGGRYGLAKPPLMMAFGSATVVAGVATPYAFIGDNPGTFLAFLTNLALWLGSTIVYVIATTDPTTVPRRNLGDDWYT